MSDVALPGSIEPAGRKGPDLSGAINPLTAILFGGVLAAMVLYVAHSIYNDIGESGTKVTSYAPFLLLFVALLIALGFEFVNGFHDTANAVATVIYTRSLPANFAVVWSGMFNLAGVLASSGALLAMSIRRTTRHRKSKPCFKWERRQVSVLEGEHRWENFWSHGRDTPESIRPFNAALAVSRMLCGPSTAAIFIVRGARATRRSRICAPAPGRTDRLRKLCEHPHLNLFGFSSRPSFSSANWATRESFACFARVGESARRIILVTH